MKTYNIKQKKKEVNRRNGILQTHVARDINRDPSNQLNVRLVRLSSAFPLDEREWGTSHRFISITSFLSSLFSNLGPALCFLKKKLSLEGYRLSKLPLLSFALKRPSSNSPPQGFLNLKKKWSLSCTWDRHSGIIWSFYPSCSEACFYLSFCPPKRTFRISLTQTTPSTPYIPNHLCPSYTSLPCRVEWLYFVALLTLISSAILSCGSSWPAASLAGVSGDPKNFDRFPKHKQHLENLLDVTLTDGLER